jgi:hypothetical protein
MEKRCVRVLVQIAGFPSDGMVQRDPIRGLEGERHLSSSLHSVIALLVRCD